MKKAPPQSCTADYMKLQPHLTNKYRSQKVISNLLMNYFVISVPGSEVFLEGFLNIKYLKKC